MLVRPARDRVIGPVALSDVLAHTPARWAAFSGGFEIDSARAPEQGRCAELIVRRDGAERRARLLGPRAGLCPTA